MSDLSYASNSSVPVSDGFFDTLRADYPGFDDWLRRKAAESAYVARRENGGLDGFLYLKLKDGAVTDVQPALLRASHIKPWADCETDAERLDVYNGILLTPHLDAAFDGGFITVQDDGTIVVSDALDADARTVLGLDQPLRARGLAGGHRGYLPWHRERVFRGRGSAP